MHVVNIAPLSSHLSQCKLNTGFWFSRVFQRNSITDKFCKESERGRQSHLPTMGRAGAVEVTHKLTLEMGRTHWPIFYEKKKKNPSDLFPRCNFSQDMCENQQLLHWRTEISCPVAMSPSGALGMVCIGSGEGGSMSTKNSSKLREVPEQYKIPSPRH